MQKAAIAAFCIITYTGLTNAYIDENKCVTLSDGFNRFKSIINMNFLRKICNSQYKRYLFEPSDFNKCVTIGSSQNQKLSLFELLLCGKLD